MTMELQPIMKKQKTKGKDFSPLQKKPGNGQREPEQLETPLEYPSSPVALLPQSVHETLTETFEKEIACLHKKDHGEDFFLQVIETTPQPFCSAYGDGRIKGQNRAFLDLLGYTEEELRTRKWADIVAPERRDQDARLCLGAAAAGPVPSYAKQ